MIDGYVTSDDGHTVISTSHIAHEPAPKQLPHPWHGSWASVAPQREDWALPSSPTLSTLRASGTPPRTASLERAMQRAASHTSSLPQLHPPVRGPAPRLLTPLELSTPTEEFAPLGLLLQNPSAALLSKPSLARHPSAVPTTRPSQWSSTGGERARRRTPARPRGPRAWEQPCVYKCLHLGRPRSDEYYEEVLHNQFLNPHEIVARRQRVLAEGMEEAGRAATKLQAAHRGFSSRKDVAQLQLYSGSAELCTSILARLRSRAGLTQIGVDRASLITNRLAASASISK